METHNVLPIFLLSIKWHPNSDTYEQRVSSQPSDARSYPSISILRSQRQSPECLPIFSILVAAECSITSSSSELITFAPGICLLLASSQIEHFFPPVRDDPRTAHSKLHLSHSSFAKLKHLLYLFRTNVHPDYAVSSP
ncbi:hypothetical protein Tco_0010793 [Tanacetum coccineum]